MTLPINSIICGDNIAVMKQIANDTVETIITDPPYGLGFMGKDFFMFNDFGNPEA